MKKVGHLFVFTTTIVLLIATTLSAKDLRYLVSVSLDDAAALEAMIGSLDVAGSDLSTNTIHVIVDEPTLALVENSRIPIEILSGNEIEVNLDGYTDYIGSIERMKAIAKAYPNIVAMVDLGVYLGIGRTHELRTIWALKISDNPELDEDELKVGFNGNHHARELMTVEAVFDIAEQLTTSYGKDKDLTRLVNDLEIWCIPSMNPDGLAYIFAKDQWWRKNKRVNSENVFGVDLNRNYPFKWAQCNGSSPSPSSDTYRGPTTMSEPEVKTLVALAQKKHFAVNVSFHSYGNVVLYPPYGCANAKLPTGAFEAMKNVAQGYADAMTPDNPQKPYTVKNRLYSVDGLDRDWFFSEIGTVSFVAEIGSSGFIPDYKTSKDKIVGGLRGGWRYLLERTFGPSLTGHVRDSKTGKPVVAELSLDGFTFFEGERRESAEPTGRYFLLVLPGTYALKITAKGYQPKALTIIVDKTQVVNEIELVKAEAYDL